MNEHDMEPYLQTFRPSPPSADLRQRVADELELDEMWLGTRSRRAMPRWLNRTAWSTAGAAAAIAVMAALPASPPPQAASFTNPAPAPAVIPIHTVREIVSAEDDGILYNAESKLPEHHLRVVSVERHAWIDPRDGAEITIEVPREDSMILPASFQ